MTFLKELSGRQNLEIENVQESESRQGGLQGRWLLEPVKPPSTAAACSAHTVVANPFQNVKNTLFPQVSHSLQTCKHFIFPS